MTEVILYRTSRPLNLPSNSCTSKYDLRDDICVEQFQSSSVFFQSKERYRTWQNNSCSQPTSCFTNRQGNRRQLKSYRWTRIKTRISHLIPSPKMICINNFPKLLTAHASSWHYRWQTSQEVQKKKGVWDCTHTRPDERNRAIDSAMLGFSATCSLPQPS